MTTKRDTHNNKHCIVWCFQWTNTPKISIHLNCIAYLPILEKHWEFIARRHLHRCECGVCDCGCISCSFHKTLQWANERNKMRMVEWSVLAFSFDSLHVNALHAYYTFTFFFVCCYTKKLLVLLLFVLLFLFGIGCIWCMFVLMRVVLVYGHDSTSWWYWCLTTWKCKF